MDAMSEYLARATIEARLASAQQRRDGRRLEQERRAERRRRRRRALGRWWRGRATNRSQDGPGRLLVATTVRALPPSVELAQVLDEAAYRIAERGSGPERRLLEAMAEVAARTAPGAASALVDPQGSEASRLRAFGLVHAHLLDSLGEREHAWLLDLLDQPPGVETSGRVA